MATGCVERGLGARKGVRLGIVTVVGDASGGAVVWVTSINVGTRLAESTVGDAERRVIVGWVEAPVTGRLKNGLGITPDDTPPISATHRKSNMAPLTPNNRGNALLAWVEAAARSTGTG